MDKEANTQKALERIAKENDTTVPQLLLEDARQTVEDLIGSACYLTEVLDNSATINTNDKHRRLLERQNRLIHALIDSMCEVIEELEPRAELERIYRGLPKEAEGED